ncbi:MAG: Spy/CpxP family protein refolding chaperone [Rhodothermales bacterium]
MKTLSRFAIVLALFVAAPAAAQQGENHAMQENQRMMDMSGEGMQACMMMMQAMHAGDMGDMMDGMQGAGMQGSRMGGGMTGMMQQPMHRAMMLVHMLPTMQEPLNLNEAQVDRLKGLHENLMASHADLAERMKERRSELDDLLAQEEPDATRVASLLKSSAEAHAEMQASMFAISQQMKNVLSTEQQNALGEMEPADMHRHMMQNMSMMDMMQMMNKMHGGMMNGGMMQGGMMQGGMMDQGAMQRDAAPRGQHHR